MKNKSGRQMLTKDVYWHRVGCSAQVHTKSWLPIDNEYCW